MSRKYEAAKAEGIDNKKLFYLSHPFTSHGDPEKNKGRALLIEYQLKAKFGIKIINPINLLVDRTNEEAMAICRHLFDACDGIIMCPNWEKSAGCQVEYCWAAKEKKPIYIYTDNNTLQLCERVG